MARINPVPASEWPPEMREALKGMRPKVQRQPDPIREGRPQGRNILGTFASHPDLAGAFFTFNGHTLLGTTLSARQRELIILRVAVRRHCAYEWAQHVFVGRDAGLTDADIARVSFGPDAPLLDPLEAALLRAVDELVGEGAITETTWNVLAEHLDQRQLLDVIFTAGAYETLAWFMRSVDMEIDDDIAHHLQSS
jgi:AhpD family alkylhydroperoxidase